MYDKLTPKEREFLDVYANLRTELGKKPSLSALTRKLGYRSTNSVRQFLAALHRKGINPDKHVPTEVPAAVAPANTASIPVLGSAPCGLPFLAEQNWEGQIQVDTSLLKGNLRDYFFLKAKGNSMDEAGIQDGDYVLFRRQQHADSGERVVALLGDEATIKVFKPGDGYVALVPKSDDARHQPIIMSEDVAIQGVVKFVVSGDVVNLS